MPEKKDDLPADSDALEQWKAMPQGAPSKRALPPATGGIPTVMRYVLPGLGILILATLIFWIIQQA